MTTEIRVPALGESVTEATVGKWYKQPGETVAIDEPLVELETDKVTIDVPAPMTGSIVEISIETGATVEVGSLLGVMTADKAATATQAKSDDNKTQDTASQPASNQEPVSAQALAQTASAQNTTETAKATKTAGPETPSTTSTMAPAPSAAKMMAENDLEKNQIEGSGKRGQILKGDVLEAMSAIAESPEPMPAKAQDSAAKAANATQVVQPSQKAEAVPQQQQPQADNAGEERVRMTKLRQTIARRLKNAQDTAAMLTTFNEVDMSAIINLRKKYRDIFLKKHDVKLGFMGFFTKAVCHALKEVPAINAEIDGTDVIYKNFAHIGIAVGTDKGLVVPVIRNADTLSIAETEKEISRLGKQARDGKLSMADMQGGTFTITNGGIYGSLMSTPILNAPQSGILGMHAIKERPIAVDGEVKIRPMMYLAVSYDHRIVDGQEAVTFLVRIKESLENPERLVLDL